MVGLWDLLLNYVLVDGSEFWFIGVDNVFYNFIEYIWVFMFMFIFYVVVVFYDDVNISFLYMFCIMVLKEMLEEYVLYYGGMLIFIIIFV